MMNVDLIDHVILDLTWSISTSFAHLYAYEGTFADVREELLSIYNHPEVTADARLLVDWLGTYLIEKDGRGSGRRFMNEYLPPKLEQILVSDVVTVRDQHFTVHVPGTCGATGLAELAGTLTDLDLDKDEALQAFLSLHDVNALSGNIMESFESSFIGSYYSEEQVVRGLTPIEDWENSLGDWQVDNGVDDDAIEWSWNYRALFERVTDICEVVLWNGAFHAFVK